MASKFQNRLVGTVILVALGVIILPGLLDGKKKHYEDQFAAIPLVPKPGDVQEIDVMPAVNQPLPAQPPEGAGALVEQQAAVEAATQQAVNRRAQQPPLDPVIIPPVETKPMPAPVVQPKPIVSKPVEPLKPVEPKPAESKPVETKPLLPPKVEIKPEPEPPAVVEEKAPTGQGYIVQLGALKNAAKANEIIASLRLSGYRAYSVPSTPVQGEITRIYVGPDASRQKLQSSLAELNAISGLNGQVKAYNVR